MDKKFDFDLYRLNLVDDEDLFTRGLRITDDKQIRTVLKQMTDPKYDIDVEGRKTEFTWSCREYQTYDSLDLDGIVSQIIISKSVSQETGDTVTDAGITRAVSALEPPLADSMLILVFFSRHLVAVEHNSYLIQSSWRKGFHSIASLAARALDYRTDLRLEPVAPEDQLIEILSSFSRLTRLRVRVRIPNPDITPITKPLYDQLVKGGIRDYAQDMRNPKGINTEPGALPHTTVSMAQDGYKEGNVVFSGMRKGKRASVTAGKDAARGSTETLRDYVRGMKDNAKAKETRMALENIMTEIERLSPRD